MSKVLFSLEGEDGRIEVTDDSVKIERDGGVGETSTVVNVALADVRHVRYEKAGFFLSIGTLYFMVKGQPDIKKGEFGAICKSPYTLLFKRKQNEAAYEIAQYILKLIAARQPKQEEKPAEKPSTKKQTVKRPAKKKTAASGDRVVFIALDTTGVGRDDRIIGLTAVEMLAGKLTGREWRGLFRSDMASSTGALAIHGLPDDALAGAPLFADKAGEIADFLKGAELVAFRANFVEQFLDREFKLAKTGMTTGSLCVRMRDVYDMAREVLPGKHLDLDACCRRFKIKVSGVDGAGASPLKVRQVAALYPLIRKRWLDAKRKDEDVMLCPACGDVEMDDCFFTDNFELWCCDECGMVLKDYADRQVALTPENKVMSRNK